MSTTLNPPSAWGFWPRFPAFHSVVRPLARILISVEVEGRERIPVAGPCILVSNPVGGLETLLLQSILRRPRVAGWTSPSDGVHHLPRRASTGDGVFGRRPGLTRGGMDHVLTLLRAGWLVSVPTEDPPSPPVPRPLGGILGAVSLAIRSGAPVLPVAIEPVEGVFRNLLRGKRTPLTVRIGVPFRPATRDRRGGWAHRESLSMEILTRISDLNARRDGLEPGIPAFQ